MSDYFCATIQEILDWFDSSRIHKTITPNTSEGFLLNVFSFGITTTFKLIKLNSNIENHWDFGD